MPAEGASKFSRKLHLNDFKGLHESFPQVWRLKVWEFDEPGDRGAIMVQHPDSNETVGVVEEAVRQWPGAIERLLRAADAKPGEAPDNTKDKEK